MQTTHTPPYRDATHNRFSLSGSTLEIRHPLPKPRQIVFLKEEIQMRHCTFRNAVMPRSIPVALMGALIAAAGCASAPKPTAELAQAHSLVDQAEQAGAPQLASADLASARSKLQQADLDARKEPERSLREAQEATADARVALARTNAVKAEQAMRDVNAGTQTLRKETERQSDMSMPSSSSAPSTPQ